MGYRRTRFTSVMECGEDTFRAQNHLTGELTTLSEGAVQIWLAAGDSYRSLDLLLQGLPASFIENFDADEVEDAVGELVRQGLIETEGSTRALEQDGDVGRASFPLGEQGLELIRRALRPLGQRRILEVGCGEGLLLQQLAAFEPDALAGVDVSQAAVAQAERRLSEQGIEVQLQRGLAEALPVDDGSVNLLVVASSLAWFDRAAFWREAQRVVTQDDHAVVVIDRAPDPRANSVLTDYLRRLPAERSEAICGAGPRDLPAGITHRLLECHDEAIMLESPEHLAALVRSWAPDQQREAWPNPAAFAHEARRRWPQQIGTKVSVAILEVSAPRAGSDADADLRGSSATAARCPGCGSTGSGLDESAGPGCPQCYQAFEAQLIPRIDAYHGTSEHVEDAPAPAPGRVQVRRDVVLSSRVRLARTIRDLPFPHAIAPEQAEALLQRVEALINAAPQLSGAGLRRIHALEGRVAALLLEQRRISKELVCSDDNSAVAVLNETTSLMVLEEDHLRLQSLRSGLDLQGALRDVSATEPILAAGLPFAQAPRLGHLTACLTNLGTGLRASCLLHLPALQITGELEQILTTIAAAGLSARGAFGEGSHGRVSLWQISNRATLGPSTGQIVSQVQEVVEDLIVRERDARATLTASPAPAIQDRLWRAAATLSSARLISRSEAAACLSLLQLGRAIGVLPGDLDEEALHELLQQIQPAHLCLALDRRIPPEELDQARATLLRRCL